MQKFFVVYMAPAAGLEEWSKTDPEIRKTEEDRLKGLWQEWMKDHATMLVGETAGLGKTKRVTPEGISDTKNDLMLYSIVEAESPEAAAKAFENHPHLQIPNSSIEIMPINSLSGMQ